jgi:hypothetical protein
VGLDKREVVSNLLESGYQLDEETLSFFTKNPEEMKKFLKNIKKHPDAATHTTLSLDYVRSVVGQTEPPKPKTRKTKDTPTINIVKKFTIQGDEKKIDIEQYAALYNNHYENIKTMLLERMGGFDVTSINKIQKQPEISLIVMVKEKDHVERALLVEDPTGTVSVFVPNNAPEEMSGEFDLIVEDDILGVVCRRTPDGLTIKEVIWPDIPLNRKINKTEDDIRCLFLSGPIKKNKQLSDWLSNVKFRSMCVFVLGGSEADKEYLEKVVAKKLKSKTNFKIILSSDDYGKLVAIQNVKILLIPNTILDNYRKTWPDAKETGIIINLLKRRSVMFSPIPETLDPIPDIVVTYAVGEPSSSNYKGITIISTPLFEEMGVSWLLELSSREINKLDFS